MSREHELNNILARRWLPPRPKTAHKGDCGRVLILAGSRGMMGAAVLCSMGAVRSGAGLVKVGVVKSQLTVFVKRAPLEVTSFPLSEDKDGHISASSWKEIKNNLRKFQPTVVAFGPGVGVTPGVKFILKKLIGFPGIRLVLDADGLNALPQLKIKSRFSNAILTPHVGELSRLIGWAPSRISSHRSSAIREATRRFSPSVTLLKGAGTLISDGTQIWKNTTGNPAMASGGMGDVLTGMIASIWAQIAGRTTSDGLKAACLGAYIHGLAGDMAIQQFPEKTLLASDVVNTLSKAFQKIFGRKNKS